MLLDREHQVYVASILVKLSKYSMAKTFHDKYVLLLRALQLYGKTKTKLALLQEASTTAERIMIQMLVALSC